MTYTHLPTDERMMIEASYHQNVTVAKIAEYLKQSRTPIYNVINFLKEEFHLEGDTIVGVHHKSAVITLVERLSKIIITLKPEGRKANDIEHTLNQWFESIPKHLFKSITFDCGKEFSNWKALCNQHDLAIYFAASFPKEIQLAT